MPDFSEVEWLAKGDGIQVRVLTLDAQQGTPWHFHTAVTDHVFALDDGLVVEYRGPDEAARLSRGDRSDVQPSRVHRVLNSTSRAVRYLLVQATGPYDFNEVTP